MTEHVLTTNGMGYFWCSCDDRKAHVLWSLNEHIAEIAAAADAAGFQRGVEKLDALRREQSAAAAQQALRDAADDWEDRPEGDRTPRTGADADTWLRDRAAALTTPSDIEPL